MPEGIKGWVLALVLSGLKKWAQAPQVSELSLATRAKPPLSVSTICDWGSGLRTAEGKTGIVPPIKRPVLSKRLAETLEGEDGPKILLQETTKFPWEFVATEGMESRPIAG